MIEGRDASCSHAAIVAALPRYAAGLLRGGREAVVRRHLATGCPDCLAILFRAPVGCPRPVEANESRGNGWSVVVAVVVIVALTGTVLASTMLFRGRDRSQSVRVHGRAAVDGLARRVSRAERRLQGLGARSERLATAIDDVLGPPASPPSRVPPTGRATAPRALADLGASLAVPSTRLAPLRPESHGGLAHGWVVWDPLRGRLFVYAMGLPPLPAPWEALVERDGGLVRIPLRRLTDGGAWGIVDAAPSSRCAGSVRIVPPDSDRVVLRGAAPCSRPRA